MRDADLRDAVAELTGPQKNCLVALARIGGDHPQSRDFLDAAGIRAASSAQRAVRRLADLEIVSGPEGNYRFFDPFFREWLRRGFGKEP